MKFTVAVVAFVVGVSANQNLVLPVGDPSIIPNPSGQEHGPISRLGVGKRATIQNEGFSTGDVHPALNTGNSPLDVVTELLQANKRATIQNEGFSTGGIHPSLNTGSSPIELISEVMPVPVQKRSEPIQSFQPFVESSSLSETAIRPIIRNPRARLHRAKRLVRRHVHVDAE